MKIDNEVIINDQNSSFRCFYDRRAEIGFHLHHHIEYELVLINSGEGQRFVGDSLEPFGAGDLVLIGPHLPHSWLARKDPQGYDVSVFQFQGAWFLKHFQHMPECDAICKLLQQSARGVFFPPEETDQIRQRMLTINDQTAFERWMTLMESLYVLSQLPDQRLLSSSLYQTPQKPDNDDKKINDMCQHLLSHFQYPISQEAVAKRFSMSTTALSRFFKKHTGKTFTAYIHELRIAKACELLSQTDRSIQDIAHEVGFSNISQFNRIFSRLKNMSPRELRKQLLRGNVL